MSKPTRIGYKALSASGHSPFEAFLYPLPVDGKPGDWVKVKGPAVLCAWGIHAYTTEAEARAMHSDYLIYEIEVGGKIVEGTHKFAGTKGRIVRQVYPVYVPLPGESENFPYSYPRNFDQLSREQKLEITLRLMRRAVLREYRPGASTLSGALERVLSVAATTELLGPCGPLDKRST